MRYCEECDEELQRSNNATERQWLSKRFCSARCSALKIHKRRGHTITGSDAQELPTADSDATRNLLKALILYGINNNSDLGMGTEAFFARAEECGFTPMATGMAA